jgi:hypothetical protein
MPLTSGASAVELTPLCGAGEDGQAPPAYTVSPDLTKIAEALPSDNAAVSGWVAGYIPITPQGASVTNFVDVTGSHTPSFSGQTQATSTNTVFSPVTGEIWWNEGPDHMYSATPEAGDTPTDEGPGYVASFTESGQPVPLPIEQSPDGTLLAVSFDDDYAPGASSPDVGHVIVGKATQLTSACLEAAYNRVAEQPDPVALLEAAVVQACPGVAAADFTPPGDCDQFGGFIDDSHLLCDTSSVPFTISGAVVNLGAHTSLLPTSNLELTSPTLSPDGKSLVVIASGNGAETLYLTNVDSPGSSPISLGGAGSTTIEGWYWNGHLIPLAGTASSTEWFQCPTCDGSQ